MGQCLALPPPPVPTTPPPTVMTNQLDTNSQYHNNNNGTSSTANSNAAVGSSGASAVPPSKHTSPAKHSTDHNDIDLDIYNPEHTVNHDTLNNSILSSINGSRLDGLTGANNSHGTAANNNSNGTNNDNGVQHVKSFPTHTSFQSALQHQTDSQQHTPNSTTRSLYPPQQVRRAYSADAQQPNLSTQSTKPSVSRAEKQEKIKRKYKTKHRKINKTHPEFELTYDMMLGIRTTVGKTEATHAAHHTHADDSLSSGSSDDDTTDKPGIFKKRPKTQNLSKKFQEQISLRFPGKGSTYTPAHTMRDFKFKSYCPDVFRTIRAIFHLRPDDYLINICGNFQYLEFISNSKSGAFFFYSHDRRFMIKTITKAESKFLRQILPAYYAYVKSQPNTFLTRFYGMHRVKPHKKKLRRFLIMQSVFYTAEPSMYIHSTFDLKGSTFGRSATEKEKQSGNPVYKDNDFKALKTRIGITGERKQKLVTQLRNDCKFLTDMEIMDYSLLLGIHYRNREQADQAMDALTEDEQTQQQDSSTNDASMTRQQHTRQPSVGAGTPQQPAISPSRQNRQQSIPDMPYAASMPTQSTQPPHDDDDSVKRPTHQPSGSSDIENGVSSTLQQLKVSTNSPSNKPATTPSHNTEQQTQSHQHLPQYQSQPMDAQLNSMLLTPRANTVPRTPVNRVTSLDSAQSSLHSPQRTGSRPHYGLPKRYDQIKKASDINFHPPAFEPFNMDDGGSGGQDSGEAGGAAPPPMHKRRQSSVDTTTTQSPNAQQAFVTSPAGMDDPSTVSSGTPTHKQNKSGERNDSVFVQTDRDSAETEMQVPSVEEIVSQIHAAQANGQQKMTVTEPSQLGVDTNHTSNMEQTKNLFRLHSDSLYSSGVADELSIACDDGTEVYYMGIIDILTQYNLKKKLEHTFKAITHNSHAISCCPPDEYADRFVKFVAKHVG